MLNTFWKMGDGHFWVFYVPLKYTSRTSRALWIGMAVMHGVQLLRRCVMQRIDG
jgi:hypothetical protein